MKNGTIFAARVSKAYAKLRHSVSRPEIPAPDDPLRRLGIAILGVESSDEDAERAIDRAFTTMVDWNEMRVSNAHELNEATGNAIPHGVERCQQLIDALQAIYDRENLLSLDRLKTMGRREARHYLEQLNGLDEYGVASVVLWSLGGHAIPVNDRLLQVLREADLVNASADRAEVQAFLERHVGAADAKEFCLVMRSFTVAKPSASKRAKAKSTARKKKVSKPK
jgi:endonuclease III